MPARRVVVKAESVVSAKVEKKVSPVACKKGVQMAAAVCESETIVVKTDGDESAIFSVCGDESRNHDDSPASEIGEYELSYLHTIYHQSDMLSGGCNNGDAILPDAVAPPSLSLNTTISNGAHVSLESAMNTAHSSPAPSTANSKDDVKSNPPDTPPQNGRKNEWISGGCVTASSGNKSTRVSNRKRKTGNVDVLTAGSTKNQRITAPDHAKQVQVEMTEKDSGSSTDRGECSPSPSQTHISETFDIRPEDDPLGLFGRDPATLTPEEQRLIKKQRRLLKNRESAQLSRHRKKMHLNALERQVEALKKDKTSLASRVQELAEENERLRKQILA